MTKYHNFIGIDIGKDSFVVNLYANKNVDEFENTNSGIRKFFKQYKDILSNSLSILEATGGYEAKVLNSLVMKKYPAHRADARKVKNFILSYGNSVKTDALDAKALALYGKERGKKLQQYSPPSQQEKLLLQLAQRRMDLKKILVAEKNRLSGPDNDYIKSSCKLIIKTLQKQIETITENMRKVINSDSDLSKKVEILKTIPGIGEIIAFDILVLLPEIGTLSRREIASLAGVAPQARDSGKSQGYRRTAHGRKGIKPTLFLAAMAARRSKTVLKSFFERLIDNGKKKMVALTALMRKILVIANAKIRDLIKIEKHG